MQLAVFLQGPGLYIPDLFTLGGSPAPEGLWIVGGGDGYTSVPLEIRDGRMPGLAVGAPDKNLFFGKTFTFELRKGPGFGKREQRLQMRPTFFSKYPLPTLKKDFNLTFADFFYPDTSSNCHPYGDTNSDGNTPGAFGHPNSSWYGGATTGWWWVLWGKILLMVLMLTARVLGTMSRIL
ncbi:MAG: hypothetical protein CM1200mP3_08450 [Chloroflexota bacterium]|nr:MAG: hypothetical protein CM1200mP3_08450 [Chloroflexota bacterium]